MGLPHSRGLQQQAGWSLDLALSEGALGKQDAALEETSGWRPSGKLANSACTVLGMLPYGPIEAC